MRLVRIRLPSRCRDDGHGRSSERSDSDFALNFPRKGQNRARDDKLLITSVLDNLDWALCGDRL
eukprot:42779-Eustigmatos_ZCMA.PRE.1